MKHSINYRSTTIFLCISLLGIGPASACSFCPLDPGPSLLKQLDASTDAVFAELVKASAPNAKQPMTQYRVAAILKGGESVDKGKIVNVPLYVQAPPGTVHVFFRGSETGKWQNPRGASPQTRAFLVQAAKLPVITQDSTLDDRVHRLAFMLPHLVSRDAEIAGSAYVEFATAPDAAVRELKPILNHRELMTWLELKSVDAQNRRVVFMLLGTAARKEALPLVKASLEDCLACDDASDLDVIIATYLTLSGPAALDDVERRIITADTPLQARRAAANALRFHFESGDVLEKDDIVASCRLFLNNPKTADYVIDDLARWEDWESLDAILMLKAEVNQYRWLKRPIRDYLEACPLPGAQSALAEGGK